MTKKTIKLYMNDPMGGRCEKNLAAALKVKEALGVELVIVKKGSDEYYCESDAPPCPSVAVDGRFIVRDGTVDFDGLKAEILKDE